MIGNDSRLSGFSFLLVLVLAGFGSTAYATGEAAQAAPATQQGVSDLKVKLAEEQKLTADAKAAKEDAQKKRDALISEQTLKPSADLERKIKDADYEVMMADAKLNSATKSFERAQKKLEESGYVEKVVQVPVSTVEKTASVEASQVKAKVVEAAPAPVAGSAAPASTPAVNVNSVEKAASVDVEAEQAKLKAAAQEAAKKIAEEKARKEEEARAQQKAAEEQAKRVAEEQAKKAAEAEAAAKKQALAAQLGIDLNNCKALPVAAAKSSAELNAADLQQQAYAQGELRRINRLVSEKTIDDVPPVSPFPALEGSLLKPCDVDQKQALKFGYMGSGQYRLETPVLAGEQTFYVKGVIEPIQRTIPEADNGETYIFFLDLKFPERYKLIGYKKVLFDQTPAP